MQRDAKPPKEEAKRTRTRLAARLSIQVVPYHKLSTRGPLLHPPPPPHPRPYISFYSYVTAYVATCVRRSVCPATGTQSSSTGSGFTAPPVAPLESHRTRCLLRRTLLVFSWRCAALSYLYPKAKRRKDGHGHGDRGYGTFRTRPKPPRRVSATGNVPAIYARIMEFAKQLHAKRGKPMLRENCSSSKNRSSFQLWRVFL